MPSSLPQVIAFEKRLNGKRRALATSAWKSILTTEERFAL
jgi:hypothetical protein